MNKSLLPALILSVVTLPAFSQGWGGGRAARWEERPEYRPFLEEMRQILQPLADRPAGSLTLDELRQLSLDLSVPVQKIRFVQRSRAASFVLPGSGQFMNRDPLDGSLFLLSTAAVSAGALAGAYFLLPEDLRFSHLDYLGTDLADIETRWKSHSLADYLPSVGVLIGGALVKLGLRWYSSVHAGRLAVRNIQSGTITFQPRLLLTGFGFADGWGEASRRRHGVGLMGGWRW